MATTRSLHRAQRSAERRFWSAVKKPDLVDLATLGDDRCWEWQRERNAAGYGRIHVGGKKVLAHRFAWELANGPVPEGMSVLHTCDNPPCVRAKHLFLGTQLDNLADMEAKGRRRGRFSGATHCVKGHPLSGDNVAEYTPGKRACKQCRAERTRRVRGSALAIEENIERRHA